MKGDEAKVSILAAGRRHGFLDARVARVERLERAAFYEEWLADGRAGDMRFLHHHKKARLDPRSRYPWARTVISAFFPHPPPPPPLPDWQKRLRGRIAAYAQGTDYHDVMAARLGDWAESIVRLAPGTRVKTFVDTGAVFEHEWAARSGVGWTGKHTLTLSESRGSYAFLGEIFLELPLEPDGPVPERCGTCTRCLVACPTGAIEENFRLDPRRCLSYLTIEHRGPIPHRWRSALGPWVFGCDECQTICPWNREGAAPPDDFFFPYLPDLLLLQADGFDERFGATALRRTGRIGLARNAAIVLGNTASPDAAAPLARALREHDAPLVRAHAAAALGALGPAAGLGSREALEAGLRDPDADVAAEAERTLSAEPHDASGRRTDS